MKGECFNLKAVIFKKHLFQLVNESNFFQSREKQLPTRAKLD